MKGEKPFTSWLAGDFERFIAIKRAGGAEYTTQRRLLLAFDRHVSQQTPEPPLRSEDLLRFLDGLKLTPRARDNVTSVVWQALSHARRHGASVERLPQQPPKASPYWRRRQPRIVSPPEMQQLLQAARRLPSRDGGWRGVLFATLLGLLYVTGIRIGEALALDIRDLDANDGILTIRSGKFGKSRALPLHRSAAGALLRCIEHPRRPLSPEASAPLFVSSRRRRISMPAVQSGVLAAGQASEIAEPIPRPHDFRHTFAVRQLARCYAERRDFERLLPALSTYLGHTSIEATRSYLVANGTLFDHAARRFGETTCVLDEVRL